MSEEKSLAVKEERAASIRSQGPGLFLDMGKFDSALRVAKLLAESDMVPKQYQKSIPNCMIALNLAERMGLDAFLLMQSTYIVHGRPGIEGKLAIALIEGYGRFSPLEYEYKGSGKTDKGVARPEECRAYATDLKTGKVVYGPSVTWAMAVAEKWTEDKGRENPVPSKWQTLPQLMFTYRAAMFFARVHCPGALLGLRSMEELEDFTPEELPENGGDDAEKEARRKKEMIAKFQASRPDQTDPKLIEEFLKITAEANRMTAEDLMVEAAQDTVGFWGTFNEWVAEQKKEKQKNGQGQGKDQADPQNGGTGGNGGEKSQKQEEHQETGKPGLPFGKKALDRVKELERDNNPLFKAALKKLDMVRCISEDGAQRVLAMAEKIWKEENAGAGQGERK